MNTEMTKEQLLYLIADDDCGLLDEEYSPEEIAIANEFVRFFKANKII